MLLEQNALAGQETSSRNSEVIHAGLYYPAGSLKARLCLRGKELLYDYCNERDIPHRRIGKLIVAQADELPALDALHQSALACGASTLLPLSQTELKKLEPHLQAEAALFSPETGIIDSHTLMQNLQQEAESRGVLLAMHSRFLRAECLAPGNFEIDVDVSGQESATEELFYLRSRILINASGLAASRVALAVLGADPQLIPQTRLVKGSYFNLGGRSPFQHLIYPVPDPTHRGLGIHATLDLSGQCRFGPDIEEVSNIDYRVSEARKPAFIEAIRRYYPELDANRLQPAYSGLRPRLGEGYSDFMVQDEYVHGCPGLIQLFGIESPGLTASLALAELVTLKLQDQAPLT